MTYIDHPTSTPVVPVSFFKKEEQSDKHSSTYLLVPVVGLFIAQISLPFTPPEWLPDEGAAAFVQEVRTPAGLNVSEISPFHHIVASHQRNPNPSPK
jgi:hypothetical protein